MPEDSGDINNPGGQDGDSQARMLEMLRNMQGAGGDGSRLPQKKKDGFLSFAFSLWGSFRRAHSVQQMTPVDAVVAFVAPPALAFVTLLLVGMIGCAICAAIVAVAALVYSSVMFLMSAFKLVKYGLDTKDDSVRPAKGRGGHPDIGPAVPAHAKPPATSHTVQSDPTFNPEAGNEGLDELPDDNVHLHTRPPAPMPELGTGSHLGEGVPDPHQTEVKVRLDDIPEEDSPNPNQVNVRGTVSSKGNEKNNSKIG